MKMEMEEVENKAHENTRDIMRSLNGHNVEFACTIVTATAATMFQSIINMCEERDRLKLMATFLRVLEETIEY